MQLAIDTSTNIASLALTQDNEVRAELTWHCEQSHSVQLLPNLTHLLSQIGASLQSIDGIIVARGPGSFNGLRVGVSTAKGLAFSLGVPIVGIGSLEVAAYPHAATGLPVCPIFNAGRGEIATALYQSHHKKWRQLAAEHITTIDTLCSQVSTPTLFCGEFTPLVATQLKKLLKERAVIATPATRLRRAGFLAELGQQRLAAGDYDDPSTLQPLYLRRPPITQPKHKFTIREGKAK